MTKMATIVKPFLVLAPMDDVTDTVFRQVIADCAPPDVFFTEFVNVDGLNSPGRQKLIKKLDFSPKEQPLVAQIWGNKPKNFNTVANELVDMGFAGIDINMGCPISNIVKNGSCSALILNPDLAVEIIKATQEGAAGRVPVSVKTRLGFNEIDYNWHKLLLSQNLDMLTVHGRTRKDMSKTPANWEAIGEVVKLKDQLAPQTLIVGNGDVTSRAQALELASKYSLDGIMIGRGVFQDPFVFAEQSPWAEFGSQQRIELYRQHVELFKATWNGQQRPIHTLNKFCKIYISDFDGAKELREKLMAAKDADQLLALLSV